MRIFHTTVSIIVIILCIAFYYVVANYYDSTLDRFSFMDVNITNVEEEEYSFGDKPKIKFSNAFDLRYKYYQICGIFFCTAFIFSLALLGLIMTKSYKKLLYVFLQDIDDMIIYFMSAIAVGLILTVVEVEIYNEFFLTNNNKNNTIQTSNVLIQNK